MASITLAARPPFNFHSVVSSHGWVELAPIRYDETSSTLGYTDRLSNGRVLDYNIREAEQGVHVDIAGQLSRSERGEVARRIIWMLALDQDLSSFYRAARGEPKLRQARRLAHGRVLRSPTLFEDVLKTILTTNTLWAATKRMNGILVERFGDAAESGGRKAFPEAASVAASSTAALRAKVRVGYRAESIRELARRVARGELDLEALKTSRLPTLELRKELLKIRGVGPYAAANLLMILGRSDFIPIDTYAMKMVSHEWHRGRRVTSKHVEKAFRNWGEYKGLAFWFWDWSYNHGGEHEPS